MTIITTSDGKKVKGEIGDISIDGLFLKTNGMLYKDTPCEAKIFIIGRDSKLVLLVKGKVVRHDPLGVGIRFDSNLEWWAMFSIFSLYTKLDENVMMRNEHEKWISNGV